MLLREVEYARPATVEEAISVLGTHDGARPLAGGQTLVNVMKARAAAPDVLVDLADLDELRDDRVLARTACSRSARWSRTRSSWPRPRSTWRGRSWRRSRRRSATSRCGTAAPSAATSASATRRTICPCSSSRSTRRSRSAVRTASGRCPPTSSSSASYMTAVGEGELLTTVNVPPSSGAGDGFAGLTIGAHGTYIVNAAATVVGRCRAYRYRLRGRCAGACDRDGGASCRRGLLRERGAGSGRGPRRIARPSVRTSTAPATTVVISPRSPPVRAVLQAAGRRK